MTGGCFCTQISKQATSPHHQKRLSPHHPMSPCLFNRYLNVPHDAWCGSLFFKMIPFAHLGISKWTFRELLQVAWHFQRRQILLSTWTSRSHWTTTTNLQLLACFSFLFASLKAGSSRKWVLEVVCQIRCCKLPSPTFRRQPDRKSCFKKPGRMEISNIQYESLSPNCPAYHHYPKTNYLSLAREKSTWFGLLRACLCEHQIN